MRAKWRKKRMRRLKRKRRLRHDSWEDSSHRSLRGLETVSAVLAMRQANAAPQCSKFFLAYFLVASGTAVLFPPRYDASVDLSLLQTGAQAQGPDGRPAGKRLVSGKKHVATEHQALNMSTVEEKLAFASETTDQLERVLPIVNDTAAEMLANAGQIVSSLLASLDHAKHMATTNEAMLGVGVVNAVVGIVDNLAPQLKRLANMITKASNTVESGVNRLLHEYHGLVDKLLGAFAIAMQRVNGVRNDTSLFHAEKEGPLNWLFGTSNKFNMARSAIIHANNTVEQLVVELGELNSSAVDLLVGQVLDTVESGLTELSETADEAIEAVGGALPVNIGEKMKSLISAALSFLDLLRSKIQDATNAIASQVEQAQALAPQVYAASHALVAMVNEAEGPAGAVDTAKHSSSYGIHGHMRATMLAALSAMLCSWRQ